MIPKCCDGGNKQWSHTGKIGIKIPKNETRKGSLKNRRKKSLKFFTLWVLTLPSGCEISHSNKKLWKKVWKILYIFFYFVGFPKAERQTNPVHGWFHSTGKCILSLPCSYRENVTPQLSVVLIKSEICSHVLLEIWQLHFFSEISHFWSCQLNGYLSRNLLWFTGAGDLDIWV